MLHTPQDSQKSALMHPQCRHAQLGSALLAPAVSLYSHSLSCAERTVTSDVCSTATAGSVVTGSVVMGGVGSARGVSPAASGIDSAPIMSPADSGLDSRHSGGGPTALHPSQYSQNTLLPKSGVGIGSAASLSIVTLGESVS